MTATFENTVAVLVKAYLDGTLTRNQCAACACGNLVAAANNYRIVPTPLFLRETGDYYQLSYKDGFDKIIMPSWQFREDSRFGRMEVAERAKRELASTGYGSDDFTNIERAFEDWDTNQTRPRGFQHKNTGDQEYDGLMRVVEVLADIHGVSLEVAESAKLLFVRA